MNSKDKAVSSPAGSPLRTVASFVRGHRYALLVSLLFAFHCGNNYLWLRANTLPPVDDLGFHLVGALDIQYQLQFYFPRSLASLWDYIVAGFYPPLFHLCMALFNIVFGASPLVSIMANMVFMALLFAALYGIGRKMGNPDIGLLGSFIVTMYPYVFSLTRQPFPDFALLAAVTVSFCLLLYTDGFTNRTVSALFGISLGIGMLVKQVFAPFIIGPTCVALGYAIFAKGPSARAAQVNALGALILGIGISLSWYLPKIGTILPKYLRAAYGSTTGETMSPALFSLKSMRFYLATVLYHQIFTFFSVLFLAGCILFFLKGRDGRMKTMLISPIIGAYLLFFFITTKEHKTTVPYLVFFALITSAGLFTVRRAVLRRLLIGLVVAVGIVQFFDVSYGNGEMTVRWLRQALRMAPPKPLSVTDSFTPTGGDWKIGEVVEELDALVTRVRKRRDVAAVHFGVSDNFHFGERPDSFYVTNLWPVAYFYWLKNCGRHNMVEPFSLRNGDWRDDVQMLILSERLEYSRCPKEEQRHYRLLRQLPMPDESSVYLYEREYDG